MSGRDPEADRYELQAQRERHDELGRALYEKRRPDAPKTWAELDDAARTEWTLIAVDQQGAVDTRRQREIAAQALAIARAETGLTPPTEGFGANGYPVEHASNQPELDEFDVAVVVFCRTRGADEADAEDRAKLAVRFTLSDDRLPRVPMEIYLPEHLGDTEPVIVADVSGLRYVGGQGIRLHATAEPYQNAGMGRPRKRDQ